MLSTIHKFLRELLSNVRRKGAIKQVSELVAQVEQFKADFERGIAALDEAVATNTEVVETRKRQFEEEVARKEALVAAFVEQKDKENLALARQRRTAERYLEKLR